MQGQINFINTTPFVNFNEMQYKLWITNVCKHFDHYISEVNYSFVNDDELLQINKDHLNHNYYTDIITFDNTIGNVLSADIAISYDRVLENAKSLNHSEEDELKRVIIHGILHCLGFTDKTEEDKLLMRRTEDKMIKLFHVEHFNNNHNV